MHCGSRFNAEFPECQEADITRKQPISWSQVMSFGSPDANLMSPFKGLSLQADSCFRPEGVKPSLTKLSFLRDLSVCAGSRFSDARYQYRPRACRPIWSHHGRRRTVNRSGHLRRRALHSRNYWRDPNSGNAFQIQVQLPQNRIQSVEQVGDVPVMQGGRSQPRLTDIAAFKLGVHARHDRAVQRSARGQSNRQRSRPSP